MPGYQLLDDKPIGKGSSGQVWRAAAPGSMPAALKRVFLTRKLGQEELLALQLLRNIIAHPHLLAVHAFWVLGTELVIALELASASLFDRLNECGPDGIPLEELMTYMEDAAQGLDYLHSPIHPVGNAKMFILHRDIKPQNLMLVGGRAKLADFGLSRALETSTITQRVALTPAYAAPECLAGHLTTRSDQYSLAASYVELRTHQREIPPAVSLLQSPERDIVARALSIDPKHRFETCGEFVTCLRDAQRKSFAEPTVVPIQPQIGNSRRFDFSLLYRVTTSSRVVGRDNELKFLDDCLKSEGTKIVVLHAFGGFGKTTLVKEWLQLRHPSGWSEASQGFGYSFYRQGQPESGGVDSQEFRERALTHFGDTSPSEGTPYDQVERLVRAIANKPTILVIDGTEVIQNPPETDRARQFRDAPFAEFLNRLLEHDFRGLCILTTRYCPSEFDARGEAIQTHELPRLSDEAARTVLVDDIGVSSDVLDVNGQSAVNSLINDFQGNPMGIVLAGQYLVSFCRGDPRRRSEIPLLPATREGHHAQRVIAAYEIALERDGRSTELFILRALALFERPVTLLGIIIVSCSNSIQERVRCNLATESALVREE